MTDDFTVLGAWSVPTLTVNDDADEVILFPVPASPAEQAKFAQAVADPTVRVAVALIAYPAAYKSEGVGRD